MADPLSILKPKNISSSSFKYEGTRDSDLMEENIDEEILIALGIEDYRDLTYGEYSSLLKEKMVADRMGKGKVDSNIAEKVTNEWKRVKSASGKFKIKKKKIKPESISGSTSFKWEVVRPESNQKLLPSSIKSSIKETNFKSEESEGLKESEGNEILQFLKTVVSPALSNIQKTLSQIIQNLSNQQKLDEKDIRNQSILSEKNRKKEKEEKRENKAPKFISRIGKNVIKPVTSIFDSIWNFLKNVILGRLAMELLKILKDPKAYFIGLANKIIGFVNKGLSIVFNGILEPFNGIIDGINEGMSNLTKSINGILKFINPNTKIKPYEIPKFEPPKFELLEIPPGSEPAKLTGGGYITPETGEKITGMGPDTQLVALEVGEVVMKKEAVETVGADNLLAINKAAGGTNANVPTKGSIPGYSRGGMVGGLLNMIKTGEGNYNSMNRGKAGDTPGGSKEYLGRNLTDMTIGEIKKLQLEKEIYAAGAYQFIPSTLDYITKKSGMGDDLFFNKKTQDELGRQLIINGQRPNLASFIKGESDDVNSAMMDLAKEFASFPVPSDTMNDRGIWRPAGTSFYARGNNRSHHTISEVKKVLGNPGNLSSANQSQIPGLPNSGSGSPIVIPVPIPSSGASSSGSSVQQSAPSFSSVDTSNLHHLSIMSIYNIVG